MPRSWRPDVLACAALALVVTQGVTARVEYRVEVVRANAAGRRVLARGVVSGPPETALRLELHADSLDVGALFSLEHMRESTVTLAGGFYTQRRLAQSRRGLPLWEHDSYERSTPLDWGTTARIFPSGAPAAGASDSLWVEITASRFPAGAMIKPSESSSIEDASVMFTLAAVVRPRRAVVWLTLIRGDTASPPRRLDLMIDAPARTLELPVGGRDRLRLEFALARSEPPPYDRDRVLGVDADLVCLRVGEPGGSGPLRVTCGRLNNVARRLPLAGQDTLVATFAWPAAR